MRRQQNAGPGRRVVWAGVVGALVVTSAVALPTYGSRGGDLLRRYDATKAAVLEALPHTDPPGAAPHDHNDPATKNSLSRAGETGADVQDPTTAAQKRANAAYVAAERQTADPALTTVRVTPHRTKHPRTRYAMANGCYTLTRRGKPYFFKPTELGRYLIYDARRQFVTAAGGTAAEPSTDTVWKARKHGRKLTFRSGSTPLKQGGRTAFRLTRAKGCASYPESQIGIKGRPHAGVTPYQEVRGYVDAHTHGMAFEFLGGAHCGKPWDAYGAPYALVDCPDHMTGVNPLESFLSGNPSHDPVGWPTFKDWPAPESLTHEGTYYRWLERSWRGGQRIFVNLLVENGQLCRLYPYKRDGLSDATCDEMESVARQAKDMYRMQNYVDAQFGGPGKGFYRIVKNPFQARKVINAGKMAVIMGIETSVPFGCTFKALPTGDVPAAACTAESIDKQLTMVHKWGVRQMELVNKFDNALTGVAGDAGETGAVVNNANFSETGTYWDMQHCEPANPDAHDKNQYAAPEIDPEQQDALFGALGEVFGAQQVGPVYPPPDHCNSRGLTTLGEDTIRGLAKRHMIFDPDHMSVKARQSSLDQLERMKYPGVVSSHSWSTQDAYPRIYKLGGFITPYAGDSTGFVEKWRAHLGWADKRFYWGIGYGADMNGLGAQGDPRGADVPNPVTYPFRGMNGITVKKQHAGQRVYDINRDGVAQYGLYPDWIQDLRKVADTQDGDGAAIVEDMSRGAEAYLQIWERAQGIRPDSCRNPGLRTSVTRVQSLVHRGMTTRQVMKAVGQPFTRFGRHSTFCATAPGAPKVRMQVSFDRSGHVTALRRRG
ncbi:peptidase [Nocardioides sp. KIGAM211]|uniref:Peptidase n=1 Tax=Nocardioides luti TaxID=2761101 RepID=A0A7X0RHI3_9ACTN|nr:peptidase [Nocardioides luti]MBB6628292.1 peptidase [Nocardioides luti]